MAFPISTEPNTWLTYPPSDSPTLSEATDEDSVHMLSLSATETAAEGLGGRYVRYRRRA